MKKKYIYRILNYAILVFMLVFLILNASAQSFWSDEMSTIGYIRSGTSLFDMIKGYMVVDAVNLPLYPLILYVVYRIVPYGEVYLLLPSIIFTISAIWIIGRIGYLCGDEDNELCAIGLGSVSYWLICRGAWDIRCYSLLILLSALTLYFYMRRMKEENSKNIVCYGICMLMLFYTHWFGSIMMIFFAFYDLVLYIRKKITVRCIGSYLLAGGLFLPWCIGMLATTTRNLLGNNAASKPPTVESIEEVFIYLSGNSFLGKVILYWGIVVGIVCCLKNRKRGCDKLFLLLGSCSWLIGVVYVYCAYINPSGSFFENKYFFVLLPQILLIMSYGLSTTKRVIVSFISMRKKQFLKVIELLFIFMGMLLYGRLAWSNCVECKAFSQEMRMPYRQCAEYLTEAGEIYEEDVLLVSAETSNLTEAWYDYYFRKRGFDIPRNSYVMRVNRACDILDEWSLQEEQKVLEQYEKILVFGISFSVSEEFQNFIDENYNLVNNIYDYGILEYVHK